MTVRCLMVLCLLHACAVAAGESVEVRAAVEGVVLGEAFEVIVVRRYPRGSSASEFDPRSLAPLDFVVTKRNREIVGDDVVETVVGRARAWALERLDVPAVPMVTRDARGGEGVSWSEPFTLTVAGVLDGEDLGPLESPGDAVVLPLRWRRSLRWGVAASVLALIALALNWRSAKDAAPPAEDPFDAARNDLAGLRHRLDDGEFAVLQEAGALLRRLIEAVDDFPATRMTSREVGEALDSAKARDAGHVAALLVTVDEASFGAGRPSAEEVSAFLDRFEDVIVARETLRSDSEA